jgi:hypothetical protein
MPHRGRSNADSVLIASLASGRTQDQAAEKAGVSARTVRRRLEDPEFVAQVDAARRDLLQRSIAQLMASSMAAVATMHSLLRANSENVRLGAARAILELGQKLREGIDVEERLARLEALAAAQEGRR